MSRKAKTFDDIARELIKEFLLKKNDLIKRHTGKKINLINKRDLREIDKWPTEYLFRIFVNFGTVGKDCFTCPWCLIFCCGDCLYGKRHKICGDPNSTYGRIIHNKTLGIVPILHIEGINKLTSKFRIKMDKILEKVYEKSGSIEI